MVPDPVLVLIAQDNLDIACTAIEKAAMERAVLDVDEGFAASYEVRQRHREVGLFVIVPCYNTTNFLSFALDNRFGIHQLLHQTSPLTFLIPYELSPMVSNKSRLQCTKILVCIFFR